MFKDLIFGKQKAWYADSNTFTEIRIKKDSFIKQSFNLPKDFELADPHYFFSDSNTIYLATQGKVQKFVESEKHWMIDSSFSSILGKDKMIAKCYFASANQRLLLSIADLNNYQDYTTCFFRKNKSLWEIETNLSAFLGNIRINDIFLQSENLWWIGTRDELYAFNPELAKINDTNRIVSIRKIENKATHTTIWLGYNTEKTKTFHFSKEALSFQFSTNRFINRQKIKYSYLLEGYQENWSEYASTNQVDFTNLHEGEYSLHVKARFMDGYTTEPVSYSFKISPPWHRTILAYLIYLSLIVFIGYIIFRWRLYYVQQDRKRLEKKVQIRTKQLNASNDELIQKTHELEEMDRVKSNFFANISHELRTPLTLILGPLNNLIGKEKNLDKLGEYEVMKRNSLALKQHIEQFLELSKIEAGNLKLVKELTDFISFSRRILAAFESLAKIKNIQLLIEAPETNLYASIDQKNMEIVLNNLLSNAIKFTPEGGKVTLSLNKSEFAVTIKVQDTGIGIDKQNQPFIFKRFYQADNSISKKYEGTGIGLALSKEIVELHQGTIGVKSEQGKGSIFTIELPVSDDSVHQPELKEEIEPSYPISLPAYFTPDKHESTENAPQVLIVEDNLDMQNYLKNLLNIQFEVHVASNGEEGLNKAREIAPHLIVSDVMMPIKDGFTMVDEIRAIKEISHIPIILLTARADEESKLLGLRKGVEEYLSKPFSKEELLIRINNLIKRRAHAKEVVSKKLVLEPQELDITSLDEQFLLKAGEIIEQNLSNSDFDIQQLSDNMALSRRHLYRKIKLLTDMSPSEFVRSYRLKKAAQLLQQKAENVSQIAYSVGFDDLSYFTKCFKAQFGKTPKEFSV